MLAAADFRQYITYISLMEHATTSARAVTPLPWCNGRAAGVPTTYPRTNRALANAVKTARDILMSSVGAKTLDSTDTSHCTNTLLALREVHLAQQQAARQPRLPAVRSRQPRRRVNNQPPRSQASNPLPKRRPLPRSRRLPAM